MATLDLDTYAFLNDTSVFQLYAYVRELSIENLRAALSSRQLSSLGDEKVLRVKLLYSLVLAHCPHARVPWSTTPEGIDGNEAARMWLLAEAIHDLSGARQEIERKSTLTRETQAEVQASMEADKCKKFVEPTISEKSNIETRLAYLSSLKHWGLSFTGETGQPARDFLENLKDYRRFSHVSDSLLFDMLPCILDSKTRSWFRAKNFTSWDAFELSFLNALVLLRDDDCPEAPRLVPVAVGDSDNAGVDQSSVEHENSIYNSGDDAHEQKPTRRSPSPDINLRPYRSSSYCLQALKKKSSRYATSQSSTRSRPNDSEPVVSESISSASSISSSSSISSASSISSSSSISSASSIYESQLPNDAFICYHRCIGHHYTQPICGHSSANAYAYSGYDQTRAYGNDGYAIISGHPQYDPVGAHSAVCDMYLRIADSAVNGGAYWSESYGLY